eukprot:TRINITY_DN2343_c3_g1_i1.p1 TRINITY_DN2343_c3_g1~~TRINITY_DN2343_c3_g1_i1.p1  ORF type:complete len:540 (+),score=171.74 TRINITY_DN2343_c3_g1_i1:60-1679(+)
MPGYTSAAELARAKRKHAADITASPQRAPAAAASPASSVHSTPRRSHAGFDHDKRRHQTDITCSPRREVEVTPREPTVYGHSHGDMQGPPYHKSCREFNHEKVEHMTPMMPNRSASKNDGACKHGTTQCSSNETFADKKRKHNHELDSCSPRRASTVGAETPGGAGTEGVVDAKTSPKCSSAEKFRASKMMHAHGMDECHQKTHDDIYNGGLPTTPRCQSSELFRKEKALHRHGIDECKPKTEAEPEPKHTGQCVSVDRFAKEKRAHRHAIDQCCPKEPVEEAPAEEGPCKSHIALSKLKRNHDHSIDQCSPQRTSPTPRTEDAALKKSYIALTNSKKKHSRDMSGANRAPAKPVHCVSNEEYAYDKKKHRHMVDSCRGCHPSGTAYSKTEETTDGQCKSLNRMNAAKRKHDHTMDLHKSVSPPGTGHDHGEGGCGKSPRCTSNASFTTDKRHHRHEMDECSPPRESRAAEAHEHAVCTSNQSFSKDKRSHKHPIDACRTPRRELFDTSSPPVITSNKVPEPEATPATPATSAADAADH